MTLGRNARAALKWVCYTLVLLLLFGLQSSPGLLSIGGVKPVLIIPAAISVALFENEAQHYSAYFCLFVFSFMVNAFNVRSEGPNIFEHIKENTMFVKIWVVIMLVQVVLASIGGVVGEIFSCVRFGITGWIVIFIMALTMYPVDLIRKAIMRK